jgi:hypothetical protein
MISLAAVELGQACSENHFLWVPNHGVKSD